MSTPTKPIVILMADDDADDRLLAKDALNECRLAMGRLLGGIDTAPDGLAIRRRCLHQ